ncbi:adenine nucleotide alpha hydrolases-like protein [Hyaloscypha variabilis F]|uniref:Diphthine--ammonia ligase n=1 Tax=Hyaloscypha variabilis (strain UAMH 11265 / GT02V1 / F) TaxID=1149755 RepID=A0A2J6RNL2_HYAVF|nr:adenine nucleotide alpha hydrolases-like protein [Hyaloscypha variabilis F]
MTESLEVIALISGGKDSFFSLLHCLQNGYKVIALGNLYPAAEKPGSDSERGSNYAPENEDDEHDLNSFMYQTVGHTVVPLYQQALGIPLYRQPIIGTAIETGTSYGHSDVDSMEAKTSDLGVAGDNRPSKGEIEDETESLVPLLRRIMVDHPSANALSTGAILSTYQRTRIESIAIRLGLIPLAYLWKYPILPPGTQSSLLEDMQVVGLDARIVKVASGGLNESFLWGNVASQQVMRRIEKSMKRFGTYGDGALLGEGGEFETLVIDGPSNLFKGRILVQEENTRIVREGGGSSWLQIRHAKVVTKAPVEDVKTECRIPDLLDPRFKNIFNALTTAPEDFVTPTSASLKALSMEKNSGHQPILAPTSSRNDTVLHWTFVAGGGTRDHTTTDEARLLIEEIRQRLHKSSLLPTNIISTIIILRSIQDFASINKVYGSLFTEPNPPARVTIACGGLMTKGVNITIHLKVHNPPLSSAERKALHVQSRSYWAPANIGPYSQAISIPQSSSEDEDEDQPVWTVSVAGQIPLIPHTMSLPSSDDSADISSSVSFDVGNFKLQTVLSLQHLWRIGQEMKVQWWTSAVAYLPHSSPRVVAEKAAMVSRAWALIHERDLKGDDSEDEEERDLWEEKHYAGMNRRGAEKVEKILPDWDILECGIGEREMVPPVWVVEVEELPRESAIEWHALLGVVGGSVKLYSTRGEEGWSVQQCSFGSTVQSVVTLVYTENLPVLRRSFEEALKYLGVDSKDGELINASYLDISIQELWDAGEFGGKIPCRSIWDASGKRVAAVLIVDSC